MLLKILLWSLGMLVDWCLMWIAWEIHPSLGLVWVVFSVSVLFIIHDRILAEEFRVNAGFFGELDARIGAKLDEQNRNFKQESLALRTAHTTIAGRIDAHRERQEALADEARERQEALAAEVERLHESLLAISVKLES